MSRVLTCAVVFAVVLLSGCGSSESATDDTPPPVETDRTAESPAKQSREWTYEAISTAVEPLGLSCSDPTDQMMMCTRGDVLDQPENWQFRLPPNRDGDTAFRQGACDGGKVKDGTEVITNGSTVVVYAGNDDQNVQAFADELSGVIPDMRVESYC